MTYRETYYDFAGEIGRLEAKCQEVAEEAAQYDDDDPRKRREIQRGKELDRQLRGVRWARTAHEDDAVPEWDVDVDGVTLGGLTGGEFGRLEDDIADSDNAGSGTSRVLLIADGTVVDPDDGTEAPYVDASMGEMEKVGAVRALPLHYQKWAAARINDLTDGGEGNGKGFADFLADAQAQKMSADKSSTDTPEQ